MNNYSDLYKAPGWEYVHEHDAALIRRDGWMCKQHPGTEWPHDDCAGPGQSWAIEGKAAIQQLTRSDICAALDSEPHCWHCGVVLACKPILRCESCPDECDDEMCDEFHTRAALSQVKEGMK